MNKKKIVFCVIIIGVLIFIAFEGMKHFKRERLVKESIASTGIKDIDVDEFYHEKTTVLDIHDVKNSPNMLTESEIIDYMTQRGFDQFPITYDYTDKGEYVGDIEVDASATATHPMYQTYYMSSLGDYWTIIYIDGVIIANPVSYNIESELEAQTVTSESEAIVGFNSDDNTFYNIVPNKSELILKVVDRIDALSLDGLTKKMISEL